MSAIYPKRITIVNNAGVFDWRLVRHLRPFVPFSLVALALLF